MKNELFGKIALCRYGAEVIDKWTEQNERLMVDVTAIGHQIYLRVTAVDDKPFAEDDLKMFEDTFMSERVLREHKSDSEIWYNFCKTDLNFTPLTASLIPYATKEGFILDNNAMNELQAGMPEIFEFLKDNNWFNMAMYVKSDGTVVIA